VCSPPFCVDVKDAYRAYYRIVPRRHFSENKASESRYILKSRKVACFRNICTTHR
jgi:hypothetical protein